ncbi:MAG: GNAT family N-acetyltransferase [Mycoplasma sp.]
MKLIKYDKSRLKEYIEVVKNNSDVLNKIEMNHVLKSEDNSMEEWFEKKHKQWPNCFIELDNKIVGLITLYSITFDNKELPALSIFLDKKYTGKKHMKKLVKDFFSLCRNTNIQEMIWEVKSCNNISKTFAKSMVFVYKTEKTFDPKKLNPNWSCKTMEVWKGDI